MDFTGEQVELEGVTYSEAMIWLGISELNRRINERVQERKCGKCTQNL